MNKMDNLLIAFILIIAVLLITISVAISYHDEKMPNWEEPCNKTMKHKTRTQKYM